MQRYHVECKRIEPGARDTYSEHASDFLNVRGANDDGTSIGERVEYAVALSEEGEAAFRLASNLLSLESVAEASVDGHVTQESEEDARISGMGDVPTDEDLSYHRSLFLRSGKKGRGAKLAILDTGLDATVAGWLRSMGILKGAYSFTPGDSSPTNSTNSHGTHTTTTATPDLCELYHYQVLEDSGSGTSDRIVAAIYDAVDRGVDIISMSLSGTGARDAYERAIQAARKKGILVLCAAGNTGDSSLHYPSACPSAVSVAAFDRRTDSPASFTTHNSQVDIAASGVDVLAYGYRGQLMRMSGTSMSTPGLAWTLLSLIAETGKRGDALLQALRAGARNTRASAEYEGPEWCGDVGQSERYGGKHGYRNTETRDAGDVGR